MAAKAAKHSLAEHNRTVRRGYRHADLLEPRLAAILKPILDQAGAYAASAFTEHVTDHMTAAAGPTPWTPPPPNHLIDVPALVALIRKKTGPVREAFLAAVMAPTLKAAGIAFDVSSPFAGKVLAQSASQIVHIAETTQANVMRIIAAAHENGLSIPETARAIRAGMREASGSRATLIARTELAGVSNGGSLAATQMIASELGIGYSKSWLTADGAKYPRHEDYEGLDGQTVALDEAFDVGGNALQFPGDPDGDVEDVANCRCTLVYVEADSGGVSIDSG